MPELDDRDREILAKRVAALDARVDGPRVGDWVRFADDVTRRISYIWPDSVQTSKGGTYYLGSDYVSMSGSLFTGVSSETFTLTDETLAGRVWFFHHDFHTAGGAVETAINFRVFSCSLPAPTI